MDRSKSGIVSSAEFSFILIKLASCLGDAVNLKEIRDLDQF